MDTQQGNKTHKGGDIVKVYPHANLLVAGHGDKP
jgi:hypothetical protein